MKKNLQRIYGGWPTSYIEGGSEVRAKLLFLLAWLHGLIQERRTYIPQGWSKFYEFSYGDFKAGTGVLENVLKMGGEDNIQWPTLYGLFENAIYGGRIDNEFDMRVFKAYLDNYFSNDMMFNGKKISIGTTPPSSKLFKDYTLFINKLAETDTPSIFGLPNNIDKAVQRYNTSLVISSLKVLQRASSETLKFDKEKWGLLLKPFFTTWKGLQKQLKEQNLPKVKTSQLDSPDPLESFLASELLGATQTLEKIENSLEGVNQVLYGGGLLTTDIQNDALQLLIGNAPDRWGVWWEGGMGGGVGEWLKNFCRRVVLMKKWVGGGEEINLGELFHPEVFMNAVRQKSARKLLCPINDMKLLTSFEGGKIGSNNIVIKVRKKKIHFFYNLMQNTINKNLKKK